MLGSCPPVVNSRVYPPAGRLVPDRLHGSGSGWSCHHVEVGLALAASAVKRLAPQALMAAGEVLLSETGALGAEAFLVEMAI